MSPKAALLVWSLLQLTIALNDGLVTQDCAISQEGAVCHTPEDATSLLQVETKPTQGPVSKKQVAKRTKKLAHEVKKVEKAKDKAKVANAEVKTDAMLKSTLKHDKDAIKTMEHKAEKKVKKEDAKVVKDTHKEHHDKRKVERAEAGVTKKEEKKAVEATAKQEGGAAPAPAKAKDPYETACAKDLSEMKKAGRNVCDCLSSKGCNFPTNKESSETYQVWTMMHNGQQYDSSKMPEWLMSEFAVICEPEWIETFCAGASR